MVHLNCYVREKNLFLIFSYKKKDYFREFLETFSDFNLKYYLDISVMISLNIHSCYLIC